MKITYLLSGIIAIGCMTGCKMVPVSLSAVGPNPYLRPDGGKDGRLQVFSEMEQQVEGDNPVWFQHTDYRVLTLNHQAVKRVWNKTGKYSETPLTVTLKAGEYLVEAIAKDYLPVEVPVVIENGKLTAVYLDGNWTPPSMSANSEISFSPGGYAVGWRTSPTAEAKN